MSKVLLFDCDGVLCDTERDGHLPAFNQMWTELGVPWQWNPETYGEKLKIGGGKERMASLFEDMDFLAVFDVPKTDEDRQGLIKMWHRRKTEIYKEIIQAGKIPPRSGVKRITEDALHAEWILGVCSTSAKESVEAVLQRVVGQETAARFSLILAGDMVRKKKPDPEIYLAAAEELGVSTDACLVIEDSRNGLLAAVGAGMRCVVTASGYTRNEDFSSADVVLSCLGDPQDEVCEVLQNRSPAVVGDFFTVANLDQILD